MRFIVWLKNTKLSFLSCAERPFHLGDRPCQLAFKYIFITPSSLQINLASLNSNPCSFGDVSGTRGARQGGEPGMVPKVVIQGLIAGGFQVQVLEDSPYGRHESM